MYLMLFLEIGFVVQASCQQSFPNTIRALKVTKKIVFDGDPSDSIWQSAHRISNFTQREPDFGKPAIGTDLYAVYDMGYNNLNNIDYAHPQTTEGVVKLIWRFVF